MTYRANTRVVVNSNKEGFFANATVSTVNAIATASGLFQGMNHGYTIGGNTPTDVNTIDRFPFASDTNAADVGDAQGRFYAIYASHSSPTHGYVSGHYGSFTPTVGIANVVDKFPFSSSATSSRVGFLTIQHNRPSGMSSQSDGFTALGTNPSVGGAVNTIDRFPFASDANASDHGDAAVATSFASSSSSTTHGYHGGGIGTISSVYKFPFASGSGSSYVGSTFFGGYGFGSQSSFTHGYASGGYSPGSFLNIIQKFSFSTDGNATDVGDITPGRGRGIASQSSVTHGYNSGGATAAASNTIDKFPFATDTNASDVGDLTQGRYAAGGCQN